jgi:ATP-dependent protease ClpP protease subunit
MVTKKDIQDVRLPHYDPEEEKIIPGIPAKEIVKVFLRALHEKTGRNVMVYYSSFPRNYYDKCDVNELDITGFMMAMKNVDPKKGVDLIMQTPGGDPRAAEGIVEYLHGVFKGDLRVIVPYCAYSAGTLISCAAKTIIMGKHSFLGPVDPQFGGIAGFNIVKDFDDARQDTMENPRSFNYWQLRLSQHHPALYLMAKDAIALSDELTTTWLTKYMFAGETGDAVSEKISAICAKLNSNNHNHGRHFGYDFCKNLGLKVEELEKDPELQDLVLGLHHALEFEMVDNTLAKLITSHCGDTYAVPGVPEEEEE